MIAALAATLAAGCTISNGRPASRAPITTAPTSTTGSPRVAPPGAADDRVVVGGDALLDGKPFNSRFVGAVVLKGGLVTPCQHNLPPVANGHYTITVLAETESSGCGEPGAQIALWTSA